MKKTIMTGALILGAFIGAAFAEGPYTPAGQGVIGSMHDMNKFAPDGGQADPEARVCAFCHTPHHAISDPTGAPSPLWSHDFTAANPESANMVAYQSPYYDLTIQDPLEGPSRLCMSCHDGLIAADQHYNLAGTYAAASIKDDGFGDRAVGKQNGAGLYDFGNDHPIGFNYDEAAAEALAKSGKLAIFPKESRFLGIDFTRSGKTIQSVLTPAGTMTCASCHDVHNKDNVANVKASDRNYFVYAPQDNSLLCISCHDKAGGQ